MTDFVLGGDCKHWKRPFLCSKCQVEISGAKVHSSEDFMEILKLGAFIILSDTETSSNRNPMVLLACWKTLRQAKLIPQVYSVLNEGEKASLQNWIESWVEIK